MIFWLVCPDSEYKRKNLSSSPFILEGDSFVRRKNIIQDTYNLENGRKILWASAAVIKGDKASFYDCSFSSVQETLVDAHGHHFLNLPIFKVPLISFGEMDSYIMRLIIRRFV